MPEWAGNYRET
jgi:hypothetical protein